MLPHVSVEVLSVYDYQRMNGDMKLVGYVFILHAIPFVQQKHFPATVGQ